MNLNRVFLMTVAWVSGGCGALSVSAAPTEASEAALTMQLSQTEVAFWAEFDRVNTNSAYETHCSQRTRFESHLEVQECLPRFFDAATEAEGKWDLGWLSGYLGAFHYPYAPSANEVLKADMKAYRDRVKLLARQDPKLAQIAREYLTLQRQFDADHKGR